MKPFAVQDSRYLAPPFQKLESNNLEFQPRQFQYHKPSLLLRLKLSKHHRGLRDRQKVLDQKVGRYQDHMWSNPPLLVEHRHRHLRLQPQGEPNPLQRKERLHESATQST